jgi:hypothetical protein
MGDGRLAKKEDNEQKTSKRLRLKKRVLEIDNETFLNEDLFMSVDQFEQSRVKLPPFFLDDNDANAEVFLCPDCEGVVEGEDKVCPHCGTEFEDEDEAYVLDYDMIEDREPERIIKDFCNRECYEPDPTFDKALDDKCCVHCRKYLTTECQYIDDFMDDVEDYEPD